MGRIEIRSARPGDGRALERIHGEMSAYYAELEPRHFRRPVLEGLAAQLDAELADVPDTEVVLVAEDDGDVVGTLTARLLPAQDGAEREISRDRGQVRVRIDYLATAEAHRRRGVATRLVQAAEAWARSRGATVAETWTYHESPLSMPFRTQRAAYEVRSVNLRKAL